MLTLRGKTLTLAGGGASLTEYLLGWRDAQHGSVFFSQRVEIPRQAPLHNTDLELDSYHQRLVSSYRPCWEL